MKKLLTVIACAASLVALASGVAIAQQTRQDAFVPAGASGGMISDDGKVAISVAQGTYEGPLFIRYTPNATPGAPPAADTVFVGSPFVLETWDSDLGRMIATDRPITLRVNYRPAELGGRSESTLRIARLYDGWSDFPSTIDTSRHTVTTQIFFGGDYVLLASNTPAPAAPQAPAPAAAPAPPPAQVPAPMQPPAPAPTSSSVFSGKVFYDKNGNGVMDGDDFPVGGAGVIATAGDWYSFVRTGGDGSFRFGDLAGATYTVNVVVGPEWEYTTPVSATRTVTGQPGFTGTADFGIWLAQK